MAIACKCDRCGKYYMPEAGEGRSPRIVFGHIPVIICKGVDKTYDRDAESFDLCWDCANDFLKWRIANSNGGSEDA